MKRVAVFFNTSKLGGAERSMAHQICQFPTDVYCDVYIPKIEGESSELLELISANKNVRHIYHFSYPDVLYQISRSRFQIASQFLWIIVSIFEIFLNLRRHHLSKYRYIWANGNKVGAITFLYSLVSCYKGNFVWHFRDYPHFKGAWRYFWKIFSLPRSFTLHLVGNSFSVRDSLESAFSSEHIKKYKVYNPVGEKDSSFHRDDSALRTIGIVSMFAPWKGIHYVLLWALMMEEDLKKLGINKIHIYGGNIYKTLGDHSRYTMDLRELMDKFPSSDFIEFCGVKKPTEIFSEIDLLIHSSLEPEPFGRVITEAYLHRIPVISTGLGGAGELIAQGRGHYSPPYNYLDLMNKVQWLIVHKEDRVRAVEAAYKFAMNIERDVPMELAKIFL